MSSASLQSLADDALSVLAAEEHDDMLRDLREDDDETQAQADAAADQQHADNCNEHAQSHNEAHTQAQMQNDEDDRSDDEYNLDGDARRTDAHRQDEDDEQQRYSSEEHSPEPADRTVIEMPLQPAPTSAASASAAAASVVVAELYSHLAHRSAHAAPPPLSDARSTSAESDALASPQPVRAAPRPHTRYAPPPQQQQQSLDDEFDAQRSRGDRDAAFASNSARSTSAASAAAALPAAAAFSYSVPAVRPSSSAAAALSSSASQTRTSLHTSSRADLRPALPMSLEPSTLDSGVSRSRWLEQKRFVLTKLAHALRNKSAEIAQRAHSIESDQLACERQLAQTLAQYIRKSSHTLASFGDALADIQTRVDVALERADTELARFDSKAAPSGAHGDDAVDDPQRFAQVAHALETELQGILSDVSARDNFRLDSSSSTAAGALQPFDPFNVLALQACQREKAQLEQRLKEREMGATQLVSIAASQPGACSTIVPLPETQGVLLTLQRQVEELSTKYAASSSDLARLQTEHASLVHTLRHERSTASSAQTTLHEQVARLEEALRVEQAANHSLHASLESNAHQGASASGALAALQASAASAALSFHRREAERNAEAATLRAENQRAFEAAKHEIATLHQRIQQMHASHAAEMLKARTAAEQAAEQSSHAQSLQFAQEKDQLQQQLAHCKTELDQSRTELLVDRRAALAQLDQKVALVENQSARALHESHQNLVQLQREMAQREREADVLRTQLAELRSQTESRSASDVASLAQSARALESQSSRVSDLTRSLSQKDHALQAAQRQVAQAAELEASLKLEVAELRAGAKHAQDQLRDQSREAAALQTQLKDLTRRREEEKEAATQAATQAASQFVKLQAAEHALDLANTRAADLLRASDAAATEASKRELDLAQRLRESEAERLAAQVESESVRSRLEAQCAQLSSSLVESKAATLAAREQQERDLARYAALAQEASGASHHDAQRLKAQMELQLEVQLTRFIAGHTARLAHLSRSIAEQTAIASNLGLWASDGTDGLADAAAVSSLRAAVTQPASGGGGSASSALDSPIYSEQGRGSSMFSLAPLSLPATKLQFEGLVSQVEMQLQALLAAAQQGKSRSSDRYQSMIQQLKRQARAQLSRTEAEAVQRVTSLQSQHNHAMSSFRVDCDTLLTAAAQEKAELESRMRDEAAQAAQAMQEATAQFEAVVAQDREQALAHYTSLLDAAESAHKDAEAAWVSEKEALLAEAAAHQLACTTSEAAWATKLAASEQEAQSRLQRLKEIEEAHGQHVRELDTRHKAALLESLALYERKALLESQLAREEANTTLDRTARDAARQIESLERSHKDALDAMELKYVRQIETLQSEHEAALEAAEQRSQTLRDALDAAHKHDREQMQQSHEAALSASLAATQSRMEQMQLEQDQAMQALRDEHDATIDQLQAEHEQALADMQVKNMAAVRNIIATTQQQGSAGQSMQQQLTSVGAARRGSQQPSRGGSATSSTDSSPAPQQQQQQQYHNRHAGIVRRTLAPPRHSPVQAQQAQPQRRAQQRAPALSQQHQATEHTGRAAERSDRILQSHPASSSSGLYHVQRLAPEGYSGSDSDSGSVSGSDDAVSQARDHIGSYPTHIVPSGAFLPQRDDSAFASDSDEEDEGESRDADEATQSSGSNSAISTPIATSRTQRSQDGGGSASSISSRGSARSIHSSRSSGPKHARALSNAAAIAAQHDAELASLQQVVQQSSRQTQSQVENLQLQLLDQQRSHERVLSDSQEQAERELQDLKSSLAQAKSRLEEALSQSEHHKQHADSLTERWRALSQAHEELQERMVQLTAQLQVAQVDHVAALEKQRRDSDAEIAGLRSKLAASESALRLQSDESSASREELVSTHAAERKRWESLLESRLEELNVRHSAAISELTATHARALSDLRSQIDREVAQQLAQSKESYEAMLRVSDASIVQQQSLLAQFETRCADLTTLVKQKDGELVALHAAHNAELQSRLDLWRANRRREIAAHSTYIADKMSALSLHQTRREEALCKECRTRPQATTFRAGFLRLTEEAASFVSAGGIMSPRVGSPEPVARERVPTPTPLSAQSASPSQVSASAAATPSAPSAVASSSISPPAAAVRQESPGTITAKYTVRAAAHAAAQAAAAAAATAAPLADEDDVKAPAPASIVASTPQSRQEGVLTLRFHAPTPTSAAHADAAGSTANTPRARLTYTPAAAQGQVITVDSIGGFGSAQTARTGAFSKPPSPFLSSAASTPTLRSAVGSARVSPAAPAPTASASATSPAVASSLDQYLANYQLDA